MFLEKYTKERKGKKRRSRIRCNKLLFFTEMSSEGLSIEDKKQHQSYILNTAGKWRNRWRIKFLIYLDLFQIPIPTVSSWSIFVKCVCKKMTLIQQVLCILCLFFNQYVILRVKVYSELCSIWIKMKFLFLKAFMPRYFRDAI